MVDQPRVHERDVEPGPEMGQPDIRFKQPLADIFQEELFGLDNIRLFIIEQGHDLRLARTNFLEPNAKHDPEVGDEGRGFDVPG